MIEEKDIKSENKIASYEGVDLSKLGDDFDRSKMIFKLEPGFSWNPIRDFPRNHKCFCGSGKKFKKCHLDKCSPVIETSKVKELKDAMRKILLGIEEIESNQFERKNQFDGKNPYDRMA